MLYISDKECAMEKTDLAIEKVHTKFPSKYDPSKEVRVFKNPSFLEFQNAQRKSTNNEIRGLLKGNAIYIWDADLALHDEISEILSMESDAKFTIDSSGKYLDVGDIPNVISDHPTLKRMLGVK